MQRKLFGRLAPRQARHRECTLWFLRCKFVSTGKGNAFSLHFIESAQKGHDEIYQVFIVLHQQVPGFHDQVVTGRTLIFVSLWTWALFLETVSSISRRKSASRVKKPAAMQRRSEVSSSTYATATIGHNRVHILLKWNKADTYEASTESCVGCEMLSSSEFRWNLPCGFAHDIIHSRHSAASSGLANNYEILVLNSATRCVWNQ